MSNKVIRAYMPQAGIPRMGMASCDAPFPLGFRDFSGRLVKISDQEHGSWKHGGAVGPIRCPQASDGEPGHVVRVDGHASGRDEQARAGVDERPHPVHDDVLVIRDVVHSHDLATKGLKLFLDHGSESILNSPIIDLVARDDDSCPRLAQGLDRQDVPDALCRPHGFFHHGAFDHQGEVEGSAVAIMEITEHIQAQQALRRGEQEFRALFEVSTVGLTQAEPLSGRFMRVNRRFRDITGYSAEELTAMTFADITHPEDVDRDVENFRRALNGLDTWESQKRYVRKDGAVAWVHVSGTIMRDATGHPYRSSAGIIDITQQKLAEETLRENEARFRLLSTTASRLLAAENPVGILNDLALGVMAHLECHAFFNFIVDDRVGRLHLNAYAGIPDEEARRIEWLDYGVAVCGCVAQDGVRIIAEDICSSADPRADLVKSYGIRAYACHPLMAAGRVIGTLSFGTRTRSRFSPEDLELMKTVADQTAIAMERMRLLAELERSRDELEMRVTARTSELASTNTELRGLAAALKSSEEMLRRNIGLLQTVFDGITDPLIMLDGAGLVTMVNKAAMDYYGVGDGMDLYGKPCFQGLRRREAPCPECDYPFLSAGARTASFERGGIWDSARIEHVTVYPVPGEHGGREAAIVRISDITQAKILERQIIQNEKLAALGLVTSGIAHEINNPNTFIHFNLPILKRYLQELMPILDTHAALHPEFEVLHMAYDEWREDIFKLIENMEHGSQRINNIVGMLRSFVKNRGTGELQTIHWRQLIEKVVMFCHAEIRRRVKSFSIQIPEDLPPLRSDPEALEQVLLNLLINAVHACDKEDSQISLKVGLGAHPTGFIIEISDNGSGIEEALLSKVFDPFFTTKPASMGTGLGLYICHHHVESLGGTIEIESRVGSGSTFRVWLPQLEQP
jgi:PAS domain S-box-containing protein